MGTEETCYEICVLYDQASHLDKKLFLVGQLNGMLYELAMHGPQKNNCYSCLKKVRPSLMVPAS